MGENIKKIPEILSPAGSFESLKAAVAAGCDAVYVGGSNFGARAYAVNFDEAQMEEAIDYCHLHGVRLYLTVNTLLGNKEINEKLFDFLLPFYETGVDAVIVQDMGVLRRVREWFPDLHVHASTQMAVMSAKAANFLSDYGVTRIVPARELSLDELRRMRQETDLEIEVFVHGALCYSYSGQCLFSSFQGGRSGNRGMCAAPCRMPYHFGGKECGIGEYVFSTKELCNLPHLGRMIDAGIDSFKIEGRMKKPEYVAFVTSIYKKYRDLHLKYGGDFEGEWLVRHKEEWDEDLRCLAEIYNRNGFTCGYLEGKCGRPGKKAFIGQGVNNGGLGKKGVSGREVYDGENGKKPSGYSGMLSALRPKHGGVRVGKVLKVDRQTVTYRLERDLHVHDVVEFRDFNQKPSYEYTIGQGRDVDSDIYGKAGQVVTAKYKKGSRINVSDAVYRTRDAALIEMIRGRYIENERIICVAGSFKAAVGERACFTLSYAGGGVSGAGLGNCARCADGTQTQPDRPQGCEVTVFGDVCEMAKSHPATVEQVKKSLSQTGGSEFVFEGIEVLLQGELFLPVGNLKKMRRQALKEIREKMLEPYRRKACAANGDRACGRVVSKKCDIDGTGVEVIVSVMDMEQLDAVLECDMECNESEISEKHRVSRIYFHVESFSSEAFKICIDKCHENGKKAYLILPRIMRDFTWEAESRRLGSNGDIYGLLWDGFVVRNMESFLFLADMCNVPKDKIVLDSNMYIMNKFAYDFWSEQGVREFALPFELVAGMIADGELADMAGLLGAQLTVYTHIPLMVSAQCTLFNTAGCQWDEKTVKRQFLEDGRGRKFFVVNSCKYCYNTVYQGKAADYTERIGEFEEMGVGAVRLDFYFEKSGEVRKVLKGVSYG